MKAISAIYIFLLITSLTRGQSDTVFIRYNMDISDEIPNYRTDTLIFDSPYLRQIIYGTSVLPWTHNQQKAKNFGIVLKSVTGTDCKESGKPSADEVVSIAETDTTLKIEINLWGNCCHSFLCDLEIIEDSVVNLVYYGYGATYCACDCCFGLTYNMDKWNFDRGKSLKSVMINGDRQTKKELNK